MKGNFKPLLISQEGAFFSRGKPILLRKGAEK
jgi:hypothetical protein